MGKRVSIDITLLRSGEFSTVSLHARNSQKHTPLKRNAHKTKIVQTLVEINRKNKMFKRIVSLTLLALSLLPTISFANLIITVEDDARWGNARISNITQVATFLQRAV